MRIARHNYSRVSFIRLRRTIRCKRELFRIHVINFHRVSDPFSTTPNDYNMLIFSIWNSCTTPTFVFKSIGYAKWRYPKGLRTINVYYTTFWSNYNSTNPDFKNSHRLFIGSNFSIECCSAFLEFLPPITNNSPRIETIAGRALGQLRSGYLVHL